MEIEKSARLLYLYQDFIKGVGIQKKAAADRFGVNERSLQRDIEDLRCFFANQTPPGEIIYDESQMLRDWKAMAGVVQRGERKGQPMRLMNVQPSSLCVLTTREPDSTEAERIIFAVFLVDDTYDGDEQEEGFVSTQSKFKLSLSQHEAEKMLFWRYHANENKPEKQAWSSGLHRYLTDIQAVQILRDIAELKKNTTEAELAAEFLATFSRIVGIDVEDAGEPNGVLANR